MELRYEENAGMTGPTEGHDTPFFGEYRVIDRDEQMGRRNMYDRNGSDRRYYEGGQRFDEFRRGDRDRDRWRRGSGYDEERFDMSGRGGRGGQFMDERRQWEQGYGGSRGGSYGMENQDWEDMEYSGQSRGYGRGMGRGQYGGSMRQDMGGYGGGQFEQSTGDLYGGYGRGGNWGGGNWGGGGGVGGRRGNVGGYGGGSMGVGGYGIGGGEPGGGFYGGQSRSGQYGQGSWEGTHRQVGGQGFGQSGMQGGRFGQQQSDFRGRGPKDYQRSSQRIREELCDILMDHPQIDPSEVSIDVNDNGIVELKGSVDSRHTKRMIEDCADHVRGVRDVRNLLSVNESFWSSNDDQGQRSNTSTQSKSSSKRKD